MDKLGVARVYAQYRRLRLTGSPAAARHLIDALGSKDENVHTLAGILLVRARKQSVRGLKAAIAGRHPEMVTCLEILSDIGGADAKATLSTYVNDPDPEVAEAAKGGLRTIAMRDTLARGGSPFGVDAR